MTTFKHRDCYNADGTPKRKHYTRADALKYRKQFSNPKNLKVYKCYFCDFWHLGHMHSAPRKTNNIVGRLL